MGWEDDVSIGNAFSLNGTEQILMEFRLYHSGPAAGRVEVRLAIGGDAEFTAAFEASGTFTITASSGQTLAVQIANADMDGALRLDTNQQQRRHRLRQPRHRPQ